MATAGCLGEDSQVGLYATNAQAVYRPGDSRFDYPEDVGVRVTVENTSPDRRGGELVVTLESIDPGTGGTPTVRNSWQRRQDVSLGRGATRLDFFVFEGVAQAEAGGGDGAGERDQNGDGGDENVDSVEERFRARATISE